MDKFGCCSQGYIFPRDIVPRLLEWSNVEADWQVQTMIEYIADQEEWVRWAEAPALLQDIEGMGSKGFGFDRTAKRLRNFGFELYEKPRLDKTAG